VKHRHDLQAAGPAAEAGTRRAGEQLRSDSPDPGAARALLAEIDSRMDVLSAVRQMLDGAPEMLQRELEPGMSHQIRTINAAQQTLHLARQRLGDELEHEAAARPETAREQVQVSRPLTDDHQQA
jgi:hypothetical protein